MATIPNWVLDIAAEKAERVIAESVNRRAGKSHPVADPSPAFLALKKLVEDNPRKSERWLREQFSALLSKDASLQASVVADFIQDHACSAFAQAKRKAKPAPSAFEVGRLYRDL